MPKQTTPDTIQARFLQRIQQHIGCTNNKKWVEILTKTLNREEGAIYKRLDGSTALSIAEIEKLSQHFQVSFDETINPSSEYACFTYSALLSENPSAVAWAQQVIKDITLIAARKNPRIFYISNEIPLFYHFVFPHLRAFHLYFWSRYIWKANFALKSKLNLIEFTQYLNTTFPDTDMLLLYQQIPTTEILMPSFLDTTLRQIKYLANLKLFTDIHHALLLLADLKALLQMMQNMAIAQEKRFHPTIQGAKYALYVNEITQTNNIVLGATNEGDLLFTTLISPDYLRTSHTTFTEDVQAKIEQVKVMSILLNKNEYQRATFFDMLIAKIDAIQQTILEEEEEIK
jgi:hypothetical protein